MATSKTPNESITRKRAPATTPEARENQLIALAFDTAEEQMRNGTASAAIITHFVKRGARMDKLQEQKIEHEITLLKAKQEAYESGKRVEGLYEEAIDAFRRYAGQEPEPRDDR